MTKHETHEMITDIIKQIPNNLDNQKPLWYIISDYFEKQTKTFNWLLLIVILLF